MIATGMQTPHQTAAPSKLCATLDVSRRLRMHGSRPSVFPSIKLVIAAAGAACTIFCAMSAGLAQKGATMIAIEKMDVGRPPAGFEFARTGQGGPAQWIVVSDPAAGGGRAIEQTSTDRTDYRFPLAIYTPLSVKNGDLSVRFKAVAGKVDQAAGIAMRLVDADNYYVVRANALEDNVRFYRVVKGSREELEGANLKVTANEPPLFFKGGFFFPFFFKKNFFLQRVLSFLHTPKFFFFNKGGTLPPFYLFLFFFFP